jgi:hypothetical protein
MPGLVPPYEELKAARFCLYNRREWAGLSPFERAECVAFYRLSKFEDLHVSDAQQKAAERAARKK